MAFALPEDFEDEQFALNNKPLFDKYINFVAKGVSDIVALRVVFGEDYMTDQVRQYIFALQRNPYYQKHFESVLLGIKVEDMWNQKFALHHLLRIVKDENAKETAKIMAIKELDILCGITTVDELGNTKIGRSMGDFYRSINTETAPDGSDLHYGDSGRPVKH